MEVVLDDASAILLITIIFVISVSDYGGCLCSFWSCNSIDVYLSLLKDLGS